MLRSFRYAESYQSESKARKASIRRKQRWPSACNSSKLFRRSVVLVNFSSALRSSCVPHASSAGVLSSSSVTLIFDLQSKEQPQHTPARHNWHSCNERTAARANGLSAQSRSAKTSSTTLMFKAPDLSENQLGIEAPRRARRGRPASETQPATAGDRLPASARTVHG
jgi:hypothetical protein